MSDSKFVSWPFSTLHSWRMGRFPLPLPPDPPREHERRPPKPEPEPMPRNEAIQAYHGSLQERGKLIGSLSSLTRGELDAVLKGIAKTIFVAFQNTKTYVGELSYGEAISFYIPRATESAVATENAFTNRVRMTIHGDTTHRRTEHEARTLVRLVASDLICIPAHPELRDVFPRFTFAPCAAPNAVVISFKKDDVMA